MATEPLLSPVTYGHGSFGSRCEVCGQDDYDTGEVEHLAECASVTAIVRALRNGLFARDSVEGK